MDEEPKRYEEVTHGQVRQRDGGRCVVCGRRPTQVHEIIPRSALPGKDSESILFSIENRCCLCLRCHAEVHTVWGRVMLLGLMHLKYGYRYNQQPFKRYFGVHYL